mmetsp:Transcript_41655/g.131282  ORF Transcript_41655/g.131282 Transcript_41655/m.131282 type:complete len:100 (-) Transcript_41655:610-909(-)
MVTRREGEERRREVEEELRTGLAREGRVEGDGRRRGGGSGGNVGSVMERAGELTIVPAGSSVSDHGEKHAGAGGEVTRGTDRTKRSDRARKWSRMGQPT